MEGREAETQRRGWWRLTKSHISPWYQRWYPRWCPSGCRSVMGFARGLSVFVLRPTSRASASYASCTRSQPQFTAVRTALSRAFVACEFLQKQTVRYRKRNKRTYITMQHRNMKRQKRTSWEHTWNIYHVRWRLTAVVGPMVECVGTETASARSARHGA